MKIEVQFWGALARLAGETRREVVVEEDATVADLMRVLAQDASICHCVEQCAFSIGTDIVPLTHTLQDGDQLAALPPVSSPGGSADQAWHTKRTQFHGAGHTRT